MPRHIGTRLTRRGQVVLAVLALVVLSAMTLALTPEAVAVTKSPGPTPAVTTIQGEATFYGPGIPAGSLTATGALFDPDGATAAHPDLPFGTIVRVVRPDTGLSVVVEVNDRLPEPDSSRIDLTQGAAQVIGMVDEGRIPVQLQVLSKLDR